MDNRRFGAAYKELPEKIFPSNPERREILETPRQWMGFFDDTLHNYLVGKPAPDVAEFTHSISEYYSWSQLQLAPLIEQVQHLDSPRDIEDKDIASEFTFHQINGPLVFLWYQLLYDQKMRYGAKDISDMQAHLAVSMAPASRRLKQIDDSRNMTHDIESLRGLLTEADAAVTLLEIMKTNPELVVLPAPERFENVGKGGMTWRNADFIIVDTEQKQIRGIQVKTRVIDTAGLKQYDHNFISVIDGSVDLGNTATHPTNPRRIVSLPGQIAMSLLSNRSIKSVPTSVPKLEYMRNRGIAQELSRGKRSFLPHAVRHITERVITELYQKDAS